MKTHTVLCSAVVALTACAAAYCEEASNQHKAVMSGFPPAPERVADLKSFQGLALDGWRPETAAPYIRWTYQNFRRLVPTAPVRRGTGPVLDLPKGELVDLNSITYSFEGRTLNVLGALKESFTDAFLVIHRGKIVSEHYFGQMSAEKEHLVQSMTKSFTGTVLAILIDRKRIDRNAPVEKYVRELDKTAYRGVTVQQVWNHTTGVHYGKSDEDINSEAMRHQQAMGWYPSEGRDVPGANLEFLTTLRQRAVENGKVVEPGSKWDIHDANTEVLGWVIQRARKRELSDLLSELVWTKIGAEQDAYMAVDSVGMAIASSGLCATARDLGRFGLLFLHEGKDQKGQQVVPEWYVKELRQIAPVQWRLAEYRSARGLLQSYRNHWFQYKEPRGAVEAQGYRGQYLFIDPNTQTVIVRLASQPDGLAGWPYDVARFAMKSIVDELGKRQSAD